LNKSEINKITGCTGPKPLSAQTHSARGPRPQRRHGPRAQRVHGPWPRGRGLRSLGRPRPARPTTVRRSVAHAGAITAPARASRRGRRRRHSSGDGVNGGGRAPTMVRLPTGHGERHASSPELLVDGEEKKFGSTAASPRRGGATVAGGGPAMVRRKRRVSSSSTGEERRGEALGRRSPDEARDGERGGNGDGGGSDSGAWHLRTGACGHGWSGRRRRTRGSGRAEWASAARLSAARREVCCERFLNLKITSNEIRSN
jgi:hypothetical protein